MKQLVLVRHGKSSWDYEVGDKDRPLKQRGIDDGHLVSEKFSKKGLEIDAVYSSPANRALHTCIIFLRNLNIPFKDLLLTNELYDFSGGMVMQFVHDLPDSLNTVMIFGHNHAFTEVANSLGDTMIDNVPTTGLVHLKFNTNSWKSIEKGKTEHCIFPKSLRG